MLKDKVQQKGWRALRGATEAMLAATACSAVPEGYDHWTVRMLQSNLVEMGVVESIGRGTAHRLMIISASRRTDIPAFYIPCLMNRIQADYCAVPNPFNHNQVSYIDLRPENIEAIIFWTRNPRPLFPHLQMLDMRVPPYQLRL